MYVKLIPARRDENRFAHKYAHTRLTCERGILSSRFSRTDTSSALCAPGSGRRKQCSVGGDASISRRRRVFITIKGVARYIFFTASGISWKTPPIPKKSYFLLILMCSLCQTSAVQGNFPGNRGRSPQRAY